MENEIKILKIKKMMFYFVVYVEIKTKRVVQMFLDTHLRFRLRNSVTSLFESQLLNRID